MKMRTKDEDEKFMRRAILLAEKGAGKVSPNPLVGAVLVRCGKIISEGFHEKYGGAHAEVNALSGIDARGATLYVSLEPCSHAGRGKKTPPCAPLIIRSGVKRVVIAAMDINPRVSGRGARFLRAAGIAVKTGVLSREAKNQNEIFFKSIRAGMPFAALKMAQSKNGAIGVRGQSNVRISGALFDAYVQRLRNRYDAILVGIGTVIADDPRLNCRMEGGRNPARIVLDGNLRIPLRASLLRNAKRETVVIAASENHGEKKRAALLRLGAKVIVMGRGNAGMKRLFSALPALGINSVLIEGGASTASSAIRAGVVDKAIICVSPKKLSGAGAVRSPFTASAIAKLKRKKKTMMGKDTVIEGYF